ncbi:MAG: EF-P lysine aminoacylase EpmA [Gammaproteobacteria bacterium]
MSTPWRPDADLDTLRQRAALCARTRSFFAQRDVLEVTTPVLSRFPIPTPNIQSFATQAPARFLRTSPELAHKRLLAADSGDIYELGPVFRQGEQGTRHNSEFTLLEWYRIGFDEYELMQEVNAYLCAMIPALTEPPEVASYAQAVKRSTGLDIWSADLEQLRELLETVTALPAGELHRDDLLDLVFSLMVAPTFAADRVTLIHDYPASQAVLAALSDTDSRVARRFEAFVGPLELGNGFYELRDAQEQRRRFERDNQIRKQLGQPACAADTAFLAALDAGLPECAGVAVGFDRVVMLATGKLDIAQTLTFAFDTA